MDSALTSELNESIVSTCRTGLGDELRSVVYFTPETFDLLYLRQDLYDDERTARTVKAALVENERLEVWPDDPYVTHLHDDDLSPGFGDYEFTVRVFSGGFASRVATGGHGVIVTTDELDARALEVVAVSVRKLLDDSAPN
ncbi:hypothetical protein ACFO0N_12515 [Halobium salinum]|uniref:Uncharacterized protein n=1 Tax=Halobium salinum TaxID=1364940 RepID=A0ABD5PCX9_9EURY|nr:hypothetical protein [Halobium salinum]